MIKNNTKSTENLTFQCFLKHNDPISNDVIDYPLCAVEMKNFMFAAKDTPTCMRKTETPNLIGSMTNF